MKNMKFKLMAAILCLAVGSAFTGCNASSVDNTDGASTTTSATTTTEATTTEEETTTTEEETEADESETEEDSTFQYPEVSSADDFENEEVAAFAQDCLDRDIAVYAVDAEQFDITVDPDTYVEGFSGMGGNMDLESSDEDSDSEEVNYVLVQCAQFTSYEDALVYVEEMMEMTSDDEIMFETEETEDGFTFFTEINDETGSETIEGSISPDGVFYVEVIISGS